MKSEHTLYDALGFTSEIEAATDNFCLMVGLKPQVLAGPDQSGSARTNIARKNFEASRSWLESAGLGGPA